VDTLLNALANMAWNETMPPPMIEERTLLDFDIVQDFIYQKNGIKKPLESVRGSLVRRLLEYSPTRTDHNGLNENLLFLSAVSDECFFYVRLPGERPHSAEQRYK
jgi:hypothetical protein